MLWLYVPTRPKQPPERSRCHQCATCGRQPSQAKQSPTQKPDVSQSSETSHNMLMSPNHQPSRMAPRVLHRNKPCTWAWERICYVIIDTNPGGHDRDSSRPSCSTGVCQRRLPSEIVLSRISLMISSPRTMILSQLSQSVSSLSTTS